MTRIRRLFLGSFLAFGLALGQQAAALHALGHAGDEIRQQGSGQVPAKCEQHSLFASLAAGLGADAPVAPLVAALLPAAEQANRTVPALAPRHRFHSRAPPLAPA